MVPLLLLFLYAQGLETSTPDYYNRNSHNRNNNMWDPVIDEMSFLPDSERVEQAPVTPFHLPSPSTNASSTTTTTTTTTTTAKTTTTTITSTMTSKMRNTTVAIGNTSDWDEVNMNDTKADKVILTADVLDEPMSSLAPRVSSFEEQSGGDKVRQGGKYQNQIEDGNAVLQKDRDNQPQFWPQGQTDRPWPEPNGPLWPRRHHLVDVGPRRPWTKVRFAQQKDALQPRPVIKKTETIETESSPSDPEQVKKAVQIDIFPDELTNQDKPKPVSPTETILEPQAENPINESIIITINKTQPKEAFISEKVPPKDQVSAVNLTQDKMLVPEDPPIEIQSTTVAPILHTFTRSNRLLRRKNPRPIEDYSYDNYPHPNLRYPAIPFPIYDQYPFPKFGPYKWNTYNRVKPPLYDQQPQNRLLQPGLSINNDDYDYSEPSKKRTYGQLYPSYGSNRYGMNVRRSLKRSKHQIQNRRHSNPGSGRTFPFSERVTKKENSDVEPISITSKNRRKHQNTNKGFVNLSPGEANSAILSSIRKAGLSSNGIQVETQSDGGTLVTYIVLIDTASSSPFFLFNLGLSKASSQTFSFIQPQSKTVGQGAIANVRATNKAPNGDYRHFQVEPNESRLVPMGKVCLNVGYVPGTTKLTFILPPTEMDGQGQSRFRNLEPIAPTNRFESSSDLSSPSNSENHRHHEKNGPLLSSLTLEDDARRNSDHNTPQVQGQVPNFGSSLNLNSDMVDYAGRSYFQAPKRGFHPKFLDQVIDDYNGEEGRIYEVAPLQSNFEDHDYEYNDFTSGFEPYTENKPNGRSTVVPKTLGNSKELARKLMNFFMKRKVFEQYQDINPGAIQFDPASQLNRQATNQVKSKLKATKPAFQTEPKLIKTNRPKHLDQDEGESPAKKWNKVNAILTRAEGLLNSIEKDQPA
ncbi:uncharacterized protein LOC131892233 isoform X2 [Tigriopus californicus]|uniref:uncharacterized protein LOC131892233 isoform X2 n=1 Tax=Tigriopus californicus TaxID=6832 RepID=UPI0027D9E9AB|nr:uncharacterized protein LOC131892233 isoform X2 [Tigriopus californicus]